MVGRIGEEKKNGGRSEELNGKKGGRVEINDERKGKGRLAGLELRRWTEDHKWFY